MSSDSDAGAMESISQRGGVTVERGLLRMVKYAPFGICSRLMLMGTGDEHRGVAFHGESGRGRRSGVEVSNPSMEIGLSQTSMERAGPKYPIVGDHN
jgi:hypothetical protein